MTSRHPRARSGGLVRGSTDTAARLSSFYAAAVGGLTLLFFMGLVVANLSGRSVACQDRPWPIIVLALGASLSAGFLGGSSQLDGRLRLPVFSTGSVSFSLVGGLAGLLVVLLFGWLLFVQPCEPTEQSDILYPPREVLGPGKIASTDPVSGDIGEVQSPGPAREPDLVVADVLVDCFRPDSCCSIDFRLRNTTSRPILLNNVLLELMETGTIPTLGYLAVSANYDVDLSQLSNRGDSLLVPVAEVVPPGDYDRFTLCTGLPADVLAVTGSFRRLRLGLELSTDVGKFPGPEIELMLPWDLRRSSSPPSPDRR